jgi:hypothetical protein
MRIRSLFTAVALTALVSSAKALEVKETLDVDEVRKETERTVLLHDFPFEICISILPSSLSDSERPSGTE